ncbi:MAG: TolC family protein [Melioribacteraceae bacterium]|nr:TolC family protein [Melioribacteraceae bacterium]MDD3559524.1 TolC family protein [Melioribacteraceae bacterium]
MKKNDLTRLISLTLLFFIILMSNTNGQSFTLEQAIETALENNREIKIAKMEVQKAEEAVDEAFGYALPSLDVSAGFSHFLAKPKMAFPDFESLLTNATYNILFSENVIPRDESKLLPMQTKLQSFAQTNNYEASAQVTQILFNSAVFRGIGASQIYLELSREQLKAKVAEVILSVKQAFYGTLLSQQMLEISKASLRNSEENLSNVSSYHKQGLTSDYEMMQAEVMVENIRPKVYELENMYSDALNKFKIVLGVDQTSELEAVGEIEFSDYDIPEVDDAVSEALKKNFDISSLKVKQQIDEEFIALDRSEYWPQLAAFGNYTYAGSADDWNFQNYSSTTVGLSFSMNLFNGGRTKNKVEQSLIGLRQTEEQLGNLKDFIVSEVKNTINEIKFVKIQVDAVERNVKLAEKAYEIANTRYNEGSGTQLEIKNANIELQTARTNRLQVVYEYIIAIAKLEKLIGTLDVNEMKFIND